MNSVLNLVRCKLVKYQFRLLWNGAAMLQWRSTGLDMGDINTDHLDTTAKMLWLMGTEAAAWCRAYGYEPDDVPSEDEILEYFKGVEVMPWEYKEVMKCIVATIHIGEKREYKPAEKDQVDIDTLELKKNYARRES